MVFFFGDINMLYAQAVGRIYNEARAYQQSLADKASDGL